MSSVYGLKIRAGRQPAQRAQNATEIPKSHSQTKLLSAPRSNIYSKAQSIHLPLVTMNEFLIYFPV